ncbi:GMC family oxidoreductase [Bradyrhizobium lablabi]|uniref:GMC family oxidoreductase n=1 Tax=Bradyrhizobium lablabi TaxID=722472 RepID=UPI001BA73698|nr:GMC family oxidoreductase N-terminal domain-containing protein [Bradyrhizobium lablabi]MBR0692572.1 GMC family oxidoreductase N-terminal domain-containing protein [Bradyrhizobium lablabi]
MTSSYDYVIVGAGSAGCVLAARLSEKPDARVALVEAGGSGSAPEIQIPILFPQLFKTKFDWDFASEPEPALDERRLYIPRGKVLGGSSSMNAMIYIRGNPADFDEWAEQGAVGWSYREMLPHFIEAEGNERARSDSHGRVGPLTVSDGRSLHPLVDRFVDAGIEAGHRHNDDFNGESQLGIGRFQLTQRDGERCSVAAAYLDSVQGRRNLSVITEALVTRLLFEGTRATGISMLVNGTEVALRAEREVILCAGAYGSPQMLMLSGVGPADHLKSLGISPLIDLPVGENLQDHPVVYLSYLTSEASLLGSGSEADLSLFHNERRGPLTSNIAEAGGFAVSRPDLEAPDIQLHMAPIMFADEGLTPPHDHAVTIASGVLKPTSRGSVRLRSSRPDAKPRIFCNFLNTPEDRSAMVIGVEMIRDIVRQPNLAEVIRADYRTPASGSRADIWSFIERYAGTIYHPTSTCSIGAVVDPTLHVYGIEGVRVVDASIMPTIVRGNTNATVVAIAEKAAKLIAG